MTTLTITRGDDFHIHLRDGEGLARTVADVSTQCARALVMPNLTPAVDTLEAVDAYRQRIVNHIPSGKTFTPLMSLYLSEQLNPQTVKAAKSHGVVAVKWYPKGATTNSAQGVAEVSALYPILEVMQEEELLLLVHGEVTDNDIDIFERESTFIHNILIPLRKKFPRLKMVLEHITTQYAVEYVRSQAQNLAATITAHHLLFNRNHLLVGGIKPHYYCLPILKTEQDRRALLAAAVSGDRRFFLGTDSAPHEQNAKESACGCAGCYSGFATMAYYAHAFEQAQGLDKLENFSSLFGAEYYGLARNTDEIHLHKSSQVLPKTLPFGQSVVVPMLGGQTLPWRLLDES